MVAQRRFQRTVKQMLVVGVAAAGLSRPGAVVKIDGAARHMDDIGLACRQIGALVTGQILLGGEFGFQPS